MLTALSLVAMATAQAQINLGKMAGRFLGLLFALKKGVEFFYRIFRKFINFFFFQINHA